MEDNLEQALAVVILTAFLHIDKQKSGDLLEFIPSKIWK
jgi:hypothetical protein